MTNRIEDLREKILAAPSRNPASSRPPSFGSIVLGEVILEGVGEILTKLSGRMSPTDLPGQEDRGLSGAGRGGGRPSPGAARRPLLKESI